MCEVREHGDAAHGEPGVRQGRHLRFECRTGLPSGLLQVGPVGHAEHWALHLGVPHRLPAVAQHGRGDRRRGGRRGEDPDGVEGRRVGDHAVDGDPAGGRLEPHDAAVRRWTDRRPDPLGADGQRHHARCDSCRRPAAGAAGRVVVGVWIACRARRGHGELRRHGLSRDQGSGVPQPVHGSCLSALEHLRGQRGAASRGQSVHAHDVLHRYRDAEQRRPRGRRTARLVRCRSHAVRLSELGPHAARAAGAETPAGGAPGDGVPPAVLCRLGQRWWCRPP